jgi:hypothetical protein
MLENWTLHEHTIAAGNMTGTLMNLENWFASDLALVPLAPGAQPWHCVAPPAGNLQDRCEYARCVFTNALQTSNASRCESLPDIVTGTYGFSGPHPGREWHERNYTVALRTSCEVQIAINEFVRTNGTCTVAGPAYERHCRRQTR